MLAIREIGTQEEINYYGGTEDMQLLQQQWVNMSRKHVYNVLSCYGPGYNKIQREISGDDLYVLNKIIMGAYLNNRRNNNFMDDIRRKIRWDSREIWGWEWDIVNAYLEVGRDRFGKSLIDILDEAFSGK